MAKNELYQKIIDIIEQVAWNKSRSLQIQNTQTL